MSKSTSQLINDLGAVPKIVADLGLGIAEAQKAMNLSYLEGVERLIAATKMVFDAKDKEDKTVETPEEMKAALLEVLKALAPTRYQFTETTLSVKLDLSQRVTGAGSAELGANLGAVVVNAGMTLGFGYDYRGAAELTTVIHASAPGFDLANTLLERAKDIKGKALELPKLAETDKAQIDAAARIFEKLTGKETKKPGDDAKPAVEAPGGG